MKVECLSGFHLIRVSVGLALLSRTFQLVNVPKEKEKATQQPLTPKPHTSHLAAVKMT